MQREDPYDNSFGMLGKEKYITQGDLHGNRKATDSWRSQQSHSTYLEIFAIGEIIRWGRTKLIMYANDIIK